MLGVKRDATEAEIKKSYRALAMKHHPDANNGDARAEERFKGIVQAYEVLSRATERSRVRPGAVRQVPDGQPGRRLQEVHRDGIGVPARLPASPQGQRSGDSGHPLRQGGAARGHSERRNRRGRKDEPHGVRPGPARGGRRTPPQSRSPRRVRPSRRKAWRPLRDGPGVLGTGPKPQPGAERSSSRPPNGADDPRRRRQDGANGGPFPLEP